MAEASQKQTTDGRPLLSNEQKGRLMALTGVDVRTVERYWRGERVVPGYRRLLDGACRRLRLPLPPNPNQPSTPNEGEKGPSAA